MTHEIKNGKMDTVQFEATHSVLRSNRVHDPCNVYKKNVMKSV